MGKDRIPELSALEVYELLQGDTAGQLIDVREWWEFEQGHIPGAVHIPMQQIPERLAEVNKDGPVVIVCYSGQRSAAVTEYLHARGYNNVRNLAGGVEAWLLHQLPWAQN
mgnify:CR=1 FL=1